MQFPYTEIEFTTEGLVFDAAQLAAAADLAARTDVTDVLLLAHGWNNDTPRARRLYRDITDSIATVRDRVPEAAGRGLAVVGVLWPSVRWADEDDIAGGGAALGDAAGLQERIDEVVADLAAAEQLKALVDGLATSPQARADFLQKLREQLPSPPAGDDDPPPEALVLGDHETVFAAAGGPDTDPFAAEESGGGALDNVPAAGPAPLGDSFVAADAAGAFGGGVGLLDFGGDFLHAARNLLNITSYYTMKDRAGKVGAHGVARLLDALATAAPETRRHLAGHSFGARVVAAAASRHRPIHSITLLQGAFSHHGFAVDYDRQGSDGFFRSVLDRGRLTGPMIVTHTAKDRAVGLAYAIASRLAGQAGAGVGGPDDLYGGLGRNGAIKTPEVFAPSVGLSAVGNPYPFTAGKVHNLQGDPFISSHSDVSGVEVAYAMLRAIVTPEPPIDDLH